MEQQYNKNTIREFIKNNPKGIYKVNSFGGANIGYVFIIDGKVYKHAKPVANINVIKQTRPSISYLPKHEIFTISDGSKYFI